MTIRDTSRKVASRIIELADVHEGHRVLEPSAAHGAIADVLREMGAHVDCVELNSGRRRSLAEKGHSLVGGDFMLFRPDAGYDRIVAAPNFRNNVDCVHIMHMHECLAEGGILSSLTSPLWMTGDSE